MKDIRNKSIYTLMLMTVAMACNDQLDIKPQQSISSEQALSSSENVETVLVSAYSEMGGQFGVASDGRDEGGELYGGDFNLFSELMGADGEITWNGSFDTYEDVFDKDLISDNVLARNNWMRAYNAINIANTVLDHLDVVDEDVKDRVRGEALWIRGTMLFELVRVYALPWEPGAANNQPGVPIVLKGTTTIGEEDKVSRATVAETYQQIIDDLEESVQRLPESNGFFADTYVASATLARVYLQQSDFTNALEQANRVIEDGDYALVSTYADAFNNSSNTSEDIFAVQQSLTFNAGTSNSGLPTFYANLDGVGRDGDIDILPKHLALYEDGDARLDLFYTGEDGLPKTGKWAVNGANIPVIRLAEMYLTRAECNFRLGSSVGDTPLNDINRIRERAKLDDLGSVDLDEILNERRKELAFEGQRLHDLKRTMQSSGTFPFDSDDMVFPIPRREIEVNENLEQNEAYK